MRSAEKQEPLASSLVPKTSEARENATGKPGRLSEEEISPQTFALGPLKSASKNER